MMELAAVGLPDLLVYMYYFWYKDVQNNHVIRDGLWNGSL